jgi:hypothetical protein
MRPNEITSADGGWRVLFAFVAQWPATAEFSRWPADAMKRIAAKSLRFLGAFVAVCGWLLVLDGLLPMRSHGPNPSWGEISLGVMVAAPGIMGWLIAVWLLRALARRNAASQAPHL